MKELSQFVTDHPFFSAFVVFLTFDAFSRITDVLKSRKKK